jgi:hypothetical protein
MNISQKPPVDNTYAQLPEHEGTAFAVEYLPGQFDQRADSAAECIQLISQGERPLVRSAKVYLLQGSLTEAEVAAFAQSRGFDFGGFGQGIGYLLISAGSAMQMGLAFAGLLTVGVMAMLMYELFSLIEKHTTGWAHRGSQGH